MNVFLNAYVAKNLGDDLFIKILLERYPEHNFLILTDRKHKDYLSKYHNLSVKTKKFKYLDIILNKLRLKFSFNKLQIKNILKDTELSVIIGGSMFIEKNHDTNFKVFDHYQTLLSMNETFLLGANFGPYKTQNYLDTFYSIFKRFKDVCFRDDYSYGLFSNLDNVRSAPDIIFSMQNSKYLNEFYKSDYIVFSVIDLSWREDLEPFMISYVETIAKIIKEIILKENRVILMSFCEAEGDIRAIDRILNKVGDTNGRVGVHAYNGNLEKSLGIIKNARAIIATRFHAMILGLLYKIPTVPIIYSNKTKDTIDFLNINLPYYEIKDLEKISINTIISQAKEITYDINQLKSIETNAENHFKYLDIYLKGDQSE